MPNRDRSQDYRLEDQIGHLLRRANQRHTGIFSARMPDDLTPTRFAAMARLFERGPLSQNELGRLTAMDVATIKGVVDRLKKRDLVASEKDPGDARRQIISLTEQGLALMRSVLQDARTITRETLRPLSAEESRTLVSLLKRIS